MVRMSAIFLWPWRGIVRVGSAITADPWKAIEALSAVVVAFVAVYGLFFTVIPLYSKAVLEEQKAKLEQEVDVLLVKTNALNGERVAAENARDHLERESLALKGQVQKAEDERQTALIETINITRSFTSTMDRLETERKDALAQLQKIEADRQRAERAQRTAAAQLQQTNVERERTERQYAAYTRTVYEYVVNQLIGLTLSEASGLAIGLFRWGYLDNQPYYTIGKFKEPIYRPSPDVPDPMSLYKDLVTDLRSILNSKSATTGAEILVEQLKSPVIALLPNATRDLIRNSIGSFIDSSEYKAALAQSLSFHFDSDSDFDLFIGMTKRSLEQVDPDRLKRLKKDTRNLRSAITRRTTNSEQLLTRSKQSCWRSRAVNYGWSRGLFHWRRPIRLRADRFEPHLLQ